MRSRLKRAVKEGFTVHTIFFPGNPVLGIGIEL